METRKRPPKRSAAKVRHLGRSKAKIVRYYEKTYPQHKIRRILKHNGANAAKSWAAKHGQSAVLLKIASELDIKV